jgi:glycosyltransferase involved in cell wall biosynthesis
MGDHKLFIGYFLSRLLAIPLTTTIHAHELYAKWVYESPHLVRRVFDHCAKVVTISEFNKNELIQRLNVDPLKVEIMRLYPCVVRGAGEVTRKKILIVANWVEKKGYRVLLRALQGLKRNDYVLWAVGGSMLSEDSIDLREEVAKYQLEDKVVIFGRQPPELVSILFESCDIFCLPSITAYDSSGRVKEREGIPVALMEAMYWGKPIISTFHAGISELINEILVKEEDVEALRERIGFLLDHPEEWKEMGRRNQELLAKKYAPENVAVLVDVFKKVQRSDPE